MFYVPQCSLHLLSHAADLSMKGQLEGSREDQEVLMHEIYATISPEIPTMKPPALGALLWGLASVPGARAEWTDVVLESIATQETMLETPGVVSYNTRELTNILYAAGKLYRRAHPAVSSYSSAIAGELATRMQRNPYVRGAFSAADFADIAEACESVCSCGNDSERPARECPSCPEQIGELLESLAGEVRRQLTNKHSSRPAFSPRDLVRYLQPYAKLQLRSETLSKMLDAASGFAVTRANARHLNAFTRPGDIAGLLVAFAALKHSSVTVPELLDAMGEQLRRNAAQLQERYASGAEKIIGTFEKTNRVTTTTSRAYLISSGPPDISCSLAQLVDILWSHVELGYRPDDLTLHALMPGVVKALPMSSAGDVVGLLRCLDAFQFGPGPSILSLMVMRIEEEGSERDLGEVIECVDRLDALHCQRGTS